MMRLGDLVKREKRDGFRKKKGSTGKGGRLFPG